MDTYIVFLINREHYAIRIDYVLEVLRSVSITGVPHSTPYLKGVIDIRGRVVPVVDLKHRFTLEKTRYGLDHHLVVVEWEGRELAFIVDEVVDISPLERCTQDQARDILPLSDYIEGVGRREELLVVILHLPQLFQLPNLEKWIEEACAPQHIAAMVESKREREAPEKEATGDSGEE